LSNSFHARSDANGHALNVRFILSFPDGRRIELESEELTHSVIGT
jgi:hypothetical protein